APLMPDLGNVIRASVAYQPFTAGDRLTLHPGLNVQTAPLRHPGGGTGYRIEWNGRSVAYVSDTEHPAEGVDQNVLELIRNADLVFYDASYTDAEYASHVGWGHSTWQQAIKLAGLAEAKTLVLFHHDPTHDDTFLDAVGLAAATCRPGTQVAGERMEFVLPEE